MFIPLAFAVYIFFVLFNGSNLTFTILMEKNFYITSNTRRQCRTTLFPDSDARRRQYRGLIQN